MAIRFIYYVIPIILLVPLVAGFLTEAVQWKLGDFVIMGALLLTVAGLTDFVWRRISSGVMRAMCLVIILLIFGLIWAELAVGLF